jgi:hypothetical protein
MSVFRVIRIPTPDLIYQIRYAGSVTLMQQMDLKIRRNHVRLYPLAGAARVPRRGSKMRFQGRRLPVETRAAGNLFARQMGPDVKLAQLLGACFRANTLKPEPRKCSETSCTRIGLRRSGWSF